MTRSVRNSLLLLLLLSLAIWATVVLSGWPLMVEAGRQRKAFNETFASYSDALVRGDFPKAYSYCSSEFRSAVSLGQFVSQQQEFRTQLGPLRSSKLGAWQVHGKETPAIWTASAIVTFNYASKSVEFAYVFHLENGYWRVYGYKAE